MHITPWEEHSFWLYVLKDHAYFIRDYLSPSETKWVRQAEVFIQEFERVEKQLETLPKNIGVSTEAMVQLAKRAYYVSHQYYQFEGYLLNLRLYNKVNLNLSPTYLNGTLLENGEYLRILQYYSNGIEYPPLPLTDLLSLWLEDQLGHSALLIRLLDGVEFDMIQRANALKLQFSQFIVKNSAIKKYLQFTEPGFPIQLKFARDVSKAVVQFNELVGEAIYLYKNDELINQSTLRFLEHHFPESCYFLKKLSYYAPDITFHPCSLKPEK
jgi:hypothetical protein